MLSVVFLTLSRTDFKLALKSGLYDLTHARDTYREAATAAGVGLHQDMVLRYFEIQALLLCPIAPHWAEYIWLEVLKKVRHLHTSLFFLSQKLTCIARNDPLRSLPRGP